MMPSSTNKLQILLQLFWTFFRIGPATFGGGYAMIPLIERETVTKRKWIDKQEMSDLISIAGSAPGGVGVNASAFIGHRLGGIAGAVAAIIGITLPTFLIVFLLSYLYVQFGDHPKLEAALKGIHGAIIALILIAAYKMAKSSVFDKTTVAIALSALAVLLLTEINPVIAIVSGLFIGIILVRIKMLLGIKVYTEKQPPHLKEEEPMYPEYYI
ncbi:chromate transporter [Paenibacillus spongiae]|uniref:Chromate transporter n=1 Tax=Paenibacillus spongiae TaxID=2909671 RepID=A0ABY5SFA1_9BACL|nr:chromate transporter [Paenibacillus spongiae]UVI31390.1 chromate transporter [Paenibacillus spongiae]